MWAHLLPYIYYNKHASQLTTFHGTRASVQHHLGAATAKLPGCVIKRERAARGRGGGAPGKLRTAGMHAAPGHCSAAGCGHPCRQLCAAGSRVSGGRERRRCEQAPRPPAPAHAPPPACGMWYRQAVMGDRRLHTHTALQGLRCLLRKERAQAAGFALTMLNRITSIAWRCWDSSRVVGSTDKTVECGPPSLT